MNDTERSREDARRDPAPAVSRVSADTFRNQHVQVVNRTAVLVGLLIFALMVAGSYSLRIAAKIRTRKKLVEFKFTVNEPEEEEFELRQPQRDILHEQTDQLQEVIEIEERPDVHITTIPTEVEVLEEVIESRNIEVETPDIQIEAREIDIDAPEEISEVSENVEFAVDPISATAPRPADIFKYKQPSPRDKPLLFTYNRAQRPSRNLKVLPKQFGDQEALSMGELGPANINLFGTGDFFRAMTRQGGIHARSAVDAALHWLAVHQEPDGYWDPRKYEGTGYEVGATSLAMLAFMGGGHTSRRGEYRRNVLRGLEWMLSQQTEEGRIGGTMYEQAIATIAFCEAFGRAHDERIGAAARRAVVYLEKAHNTDGGWRYQPNSQMSDVSVTGWVIQALKAAKLAQVKFDHAIYAQSLLFLDALTDKGGAKDSSGAVGYTYEPNQQYSFGRPAMTAAGLVIRQFSGIGVKSHLLERGAQLTRTMPPDWNKKDFYYWYYATYAMHNMGGEHRVWWNRRIRDVLIENQCREGDDAGSWDPERAQWAARAGRVYTTSLGALCLEVYYRYSAALNSFGVAPDIDDLFAQ